MARVFERNTKTSGHVFFNILVPSSKSYIAVLASRFMAAHKKVCKVRVLVRLRPESADYREKEGSNPNGIPDRCVRAVDSSTLELWNCRNSEESIRYR